MRRVMPFIQGLGCLLYLGLVVRSFRGFGTRWQFGKFCTPTPILKPGEPVTSIEGVLALSGALPYLYLIILGFMACIIALVVINPHRLAKRRARFRREMAAIMHLPENEFYEAFDTIRARYR